MSTDLEEPQLSELTDTDTTNNLRWIKGFHRLRAGDLRTAEFGPECWSRSWDPAKFTGGNTLLIHNVIDEVESDVGNCHIVEAKQAKLTRNIWNGETSSGHLDGTAVITGITNFTRTNRSRDLGQKQPDANSN